MNEPSLDPYAVKLERFELFSTNQCFYLVGCNKENSCYRVLKMDRTLIEWPREQQHKPRSPQSEQRRRLDSSTTTGSAQSAGLGADGAGPQKHSVGISASRTHVHANTNASDNSHTAKPTLRPLSDFLIEDPNVYSQDEIKDVLDMIHDGNRMAANRGSAGGPGAAGVGERGPSSRAGGGLKPIVKAYGVVGFIRFLDCYYLTLITRRAKIGSIGGNPIYTIKNTETIPLKPAEQNVQGSGDLADPSSVLLSMWNRGKRSVGLGLTNREIAELRYQGLYQVVDLTKNFYFSYTYELTRSLQENFLAASTKPFPPPPFKDMYAWNHFLTREFEGCLHSLTSFQWIMPIIHGAFVQRKVNDYGRSLSVILIARRSRHFAGTRYLKRGVSEEGKVANDVEHEQILHDESNSSSSGIYCSYLQHRGSIPTFWTQESSVTMPKPPIELNRVDPTYTASQLHFADLIQRYSSPILVLDLVKQSEKREREVRVGNEFRHAVEYINTTIDDPHKIRYCALDYSHISKHRNLDVSSSLNDVSTWAVNQTGFFCSAPKWKIVEPGIIKRFTEEDGEGAASLSAKLGVPVFPMEQSGVLRTNCIDCLDRTNVAQFSAGVEAIGQQLVVMGIRSAAKLDPASNLVRVLIDMYVDTGDSLAQEYGGSEAHKKVTIRSESVIGKHKELLTSIRRYYSNAFTDRLKQDAMNLFLGYYLPFDHTVPLWELETDYYLHNFHVSGSIYSMKALQRSFGVALEDDVYDGGAIEGEQVINRPHRNESQKVQRVRTLCSLQRESLSSWWKIALQSNIKQRMWMNLGDQEVEGWPTRFERLYQPEKLGQFDRFFSRGWATPVRRSHASQHSDGPENEAESAGLTRVISENFLAPRKPESSDDSPEYVSLGTFIQEHGFASKQEPTLRSFLKGSDIEGSEDNSKLTFLGIPNDADEEVRPEYLKYVASTQDLKPTAQSSPEDTVNEFKACLRDYSLKADDVSGIRMLAESAHIGDTILSGPYRGVKKNRSAISIATAIQEQFNGFESLQSGGPRLVENELKRRGISYEGVKQEVKKGWKAHVAAQKQYTEIVDKPVVECRRSDLTTPPSLRLYTTSFNESVPLSTADQIFLTGESIKLESRSDTTKSLQSQPRTDSFVEKAKRLGIPVVLHSEFEKDDPGPLFHSDRRQDVPPGFEQINEDMFARKDNKFMVFNWAGVKDFATSGARPVTKISHSQSILDATLS